jgi:hypothetical protein
MNVDKSVRCSLEADGTGTISGKKQNNNERVRKGER